MDKINTAVPDDPNLHKLRIGTNRAFLSLRFAATLTLLSPPNIYKYRTTLSISLFKSQEGDGGGYRERERERERKREGIRVRKRGN